MQSTCPENFRPSDLPSKLMMLVIIFKKDHVMVLCPLIYLFSVHSLRNEKTYRRWWSKCQTFCQQWMIKPPYIKWCVKSSFFSRFTLLFRTGPSALLLIPSTFYYYYCGLVFLPCLLKKGLISRHSKIVKCYNTMTPKNIQDRKIFLCCN